MGKESAAGMRKERGLRRRCCGTGCMGGLCGSPAAEGKSGSGLEYLQRAFDDVALFVDDAEVFVAVPDVVCHKCFQCELEVRNGGLQFLVIFRLDVLFGRLCNDIVDEALRYLVVLDEIAEVGIFGTDFLAVAVDVPQRCAVDESEPADAGVEFGIGGGVEWDEDIGHDASSSVDGASLA